MWLSRFEKSKELIQHILSHPSVTYTEKSLISSDFEFDVEVESFLDFMDLMASFKSKFPDEIKDYTYYSLIKIHKHGYLQPVRPASQQ